MSEHNVPSPMLESDYEAIEAAVMETEKGRWFLAEYARRNRSADTRIVLDAISGLERVLKRERRPDADRIRLDIGEMKDAIERTKLEIAQIKHDTATASRFETASNELDAIVTQTETATSEILGAAEKLHEIVWTMREGGIDGEVCDAIENLVMTIYTSCSFQDLTGQRTQKVVHVLRYLEQRIDSMIDIWGMEQDEVETRSASVPDTGPHIDTRPDAHLLNGPALIGQGMDQIRVDDLLFEQPGQELGAAAMADTIEFDAIEVEAPQDDADDGLADAAVAGIAEPAPADLHDSDAGTLPGEAAAEVDATLALAHVAMEQAIETLQQVSGAVARPATATPDPLEALTKAERQALFG